MIHRILWNEDGGDSSGAHSVFEGDADPGDDGQQAQTPPAEGGGGEPQGEGEPSATQQQPPSQQLSPQEIAQLAAEAVKSTIPQMQQPQRELSPEEFDKAFHMARVKPDSYNKLRALLSTDSPEAQAEGAQLLESLLQAAAKQAIVMGGFQLADMEEKIEARLAPLMKVVEQQQTAALKSEFYNANKDLVPWTPVVEAVTQKLQQSGVFATLKGDKAKAFKLVADEARKVIQGLPGGKPGTNGAAGHQQQSRTSKMSTLTSGGQGGTQKGGGQGGKPKSAGHAVFS